MATHLARRARNHALILLMVLAVIGTFVSACGTSAGSGIKAGPGVDLNKKVINLGVLTPLSGPVAAPIGIPITKGIETYFKAVNDSGGIDGFKINLVEKDSKYDPQTQVQMYSQIHNDVLMLAESLGSPTTQAIVSLSERDKMLVSAASLDSILSRQQYMILIGTPYRLQVENGLDYALKVAGQKGVTNPKIGIIYQDDAYGQDGLTGYKEAVSCSSNLIDVAQATYELTDKSFTAQVTKMKQAGAQFVVLTAVPTIAAGIIGTAAQLGYFPQWILNSPAWANALLGVSPEFTGLLQKSVWVVAQGATWGDRSQPGMAEMLDNLQKYAPDQKPDGYFQFGYAEAKVTYAILKKAADNGDLTREGLLKAFNSLGTVDLGGLFGANAKYGASPNERVPTRDNSVFGIDPSIPNNFKNLSGDFVGSCAAKSSF
ncbi:MAG TPA: ABC transporter substrate-binding protein [Ktedonobacterales bacterium]